MTLAETGDGTQQPPGTAMQEHVKKTSLSTLSASSAKVSEDYTLKPGQ